MDTGTLPLFKAMSQRMSWLGERQKTLAQNVANADTPKYLAKDLKPMSFGDLMGTVPSPSGNSVSLEDQMLKVSGTASDYQLTTELYSQNMTMLKTVLGR
jgi:flagellar basal-body rod protein FlgB